MTESGTVEKVRTKLIKENPNLNSNFADILAANEAKENSFKQAEVSDADGLSLASPLLAKRYDLVSPSQIWICRELCH